MAEQKAQWLEEKTNLQMRVDELENELEKLHQKVVAMINSYKKVIFVCGWFRKKHIQDYWLLLFRPETIMGTIC